MLVTNHHDRHAVIRLFSQQRENGFTGGGIEIFGWFISKKNFWAIDKGTRNRDALLLAARKFRGPMPQAMRQTHAFQRFAKASGTIRTINLRNPKW
jgi:hypothetical protein